MKRLALFLSIVFLITILGASFALAASKTEIEVASFQGGYGIDWIKKIARDYEKLHPNVRIKVWGNPRVWEQLRPRFIAGNPPDLCAPGWGFDFWAAIYEGQFFPLDEELAKPAYGQEDKKWAETINKALLDEFYWEGKHYVIPMFTNLYGWWYDDAFFAKNKWEVPETVAQFEALAEKIKKEKVAPLTTQGMYPYYALWSYFLPLAVKYGGIDMYKDAMNLKPGAWKQDGFLKAAQKVDEWVKKGYFQKGCVGMNHTESQMEVIAHRAAIIGCGSWLEAEMKNVTPKNFKWRMMGVPYPEDGKGDPTAFYMDQDIATSWVVPSKAKHPEIALDFLRYMTSLENAKYVSAEKGAIVPVKGSEVALKSEALKSAVAVYSKAKIIWTYSGTYQVWYPTINKALETGIQALLSQEITPEQFLDKVEKEAEKVRKDSTIPKHTY